MILYERIEIFNIYGPSLESSPLEILPGVPQGSILGRLLFIRYTADFYKVIAFIRFLANYDKAISNLNNDISNIIKNARNYYLVIKEAKIKVIIFCSIYNFVGK